MRQLLEVDQLLADGILCAYLGERIALLRSGESHQSKRISHDQVLDSSLVKTLPESS